jgi:hypothetical protein
MIKKINNKYVLYSKDGTKELGTFATKESAEKREKQISFIKHLKEKTG